VHKILIIDTDESSIATATAALKEAGYEVIVSNNSREAIKIAKEELPDLVLVELNMPELDGIDICIELCKSRTLNETIIVFYSEHNEDYAQVAAFNAGADDFIQKPIKPRLLISRLKALLKRHKIHQEIITRGQTKGLQLDRDRYLVFLDGEEVHFPRKEFELIWLLYYSPRKVFSRKEIGLKVWGQEIEVGNRTIDVHIRNIRQKIGDTYIKTVKGVGYFIKLEEETN
jgi:two-component system alkaline phosphatase synthesis response regulator PhoP